MNLSNRQRLTESAIVSAIGIIFSIISMNPIFDILSIFLAVPYIIITTRNGVNYGLMSIFISSFILIGVNWFYGLRLLLLFFIPAIFIGHKIDKSDNPFNSIAWGFISSAITTIIFIKLTSILVGVDIIGQFENLIKEAVNMQYDLVNKFNLSKNNIDIKTMTETYYKSIPAILMSMSIMLSFINYYMSAYILKRIKFYDKQLPKFIDFTLPGNIMMGIAIVYLLTFITMYIPGINYEALITNIELIFSFIFFFQGLAVYSYFLDKINVRRGLKILFIIIPVLIGPIFMIMSIIGLLDAVIDFRKIRMY